MRVHRSFKVDAPVHQVWDILSDVENWPRWLPSVSAVQPVSDGEFGVGSRFAIKQPLQGEAIWQVTDWRPHCAFVWERRAGNRPVFVGIHRLHAVGRTTTHCTLALDAFGPVAWLLRPLLAATLLIESLSLRRACGQLTR